MKIKKWVVFLFLVAGFINLYTFNSRATKAATSDGCFERCDHNEGCCMGDCWFFDYYCHDACELERAHCNTNCAKNPPEIAAAACPES